MSKRPATDAQREASRRNGAKSKGPTTEAGKAASSQNARTHGLTAHAVIIDGESEDAWNALNAEYHEEWQPAGPTERDLVTQLAFAAFRLNRFTVMEPARINFEQAKLRPSLEKGVPNFDRPIQQAFAYERSMKTIESLSRYESRLKRQIKDTILLLQQLQDRRKAAAEKAQKAEEAEQQKEPGSKSNLYSINQIIDSGAVPSLRPHRVPTPLPHKSPEENLAT